MSVQTLEGNRRSTHVKVVFVNDDAEGKTESSRQNLLAGELLGLRMSIAVLWCTLTLTLVKTALAGDAVWDAHGHQGIVAHATKWMHPQETRPNLGSLASGSSMPTMSMQPSSGARRQKHSGSGHTHGASKFRCRGWQPVALGVCASVECFEFRTCEPGVLLKKN